MTDAEHIQELEYILAGVMHSVDKWLEGDELKQDEVNRAIIAREKALQAIEKTSEINARLVARNARLAYDLDQAYILITKLKGDHY